MKARLGDYVHIRTGKLDANAASPDGKYPFFTCAITPLRINSYSYNCECVLVAGNGDLNVKYYSGAFDAYQRTYIIESKDKTVLSVQYLYLFLYKYVETLRKQSIGGVIKYIKIENLTEAQFFLPKIEIQNQIVTLFRKVDGLLLKRKQQLAKFDELVKARFVEMFDGISETVSLHYYIESLLAGKSLAGEEESLNKVLKTGAVTYDYFDSTQIKNLPLDYIPLAEHQVETGNVIISRMNTAELVGATGYVWEAPKNTFLPDRLWKAKLSKHVNPIFIWQLLIQSTTKKDIKSIASGTSGSMKNISKPGLLGIEVKKVPFELQNQFSDYVSNIHDLSLQVQQGLDKLETLKKALMQKYFG